MWEQLAHTPDGVWPENNTCLTGYWTCVTGILKREGRRGSGVAGNKRMGGEREREEKMWADYEIRVPQGSPATKVRQRWVTNLESNCKADTEIGLSQRMI